MPKTKLCKDCKKEFVQNDNARFPRKYCPACSAERKKAYDDIHLVTVDDCDD